MTLNFIFPTGLLIQIILLYYFYNHNKKKEHLNNYRRAKLKDIRQGVLDATIASKKNAI